MGFSSNALHLGCSQRCIKTPGLKSVQKCSSQLHTDQNAAGFALFLTGMQVVLSALTATADKFSSAFRAAIGLRKRMRQMKEQSSTREGDSPALF